ncbi:hypothetical protein Q9L58_010217 [Maublancomyces gigas]|uniref:AIG1-type G domain-containing protein n=1 Tax=Discina gigas TaxID=1032678 RepID=A0ABR3G4S1_9PEZI
MASGDQKIIVSRKLESCTKTVEASDMFEVGGYMVRLVDTPGFNDDELTDAQVLSMIADWMKKTFDENQKLHGIMYLQRINDIRLDSGAVRCLQLFRDICGPRFLQNTILLTTMWDKGKDASLVLENEDTEMELKDVHWKGLIESGAVYQRSFNEKEACNKIIDLIVQKQPKMAKLQEEVGMNGLGVGDTDAGKNLLRVVSEQIAKLTETFQEKFKLLEESHAKETAALEKQKEDLEKQKEDLKEKLRKYKSDRKMLISTQRAVPEDGAKDTSAARERWWALLKNFRFRGLRKSHNK